MRFEGVLQEVQLVSFVQVPQLYLHFWQIGFVPEL
jgi:hypothetical protein